jgi:hypothetical protein
VGLLSKGWWQRHLICWSVDTSSIWGSDTSRWRVKLGSGGLLIGGMRRSYSNWLDSWLGSEKKKRNFRSVIWSAGYTLR